MADALALEASIREGCVGSNPIAPTNCIHHFIISLPDGEDVNDKQYGFCKKCGIEKIWPSLNDEAYVMLWKNANRIIE